MPIHLRFDPRNNGVHHPRTPKGNDLFKQVTKNFNYWIHKFNWKKDSKALMIGAAALAGLVVATGLMSAGIASFFASKKDLTKQQDPKTQPFNVNVPKQVNGEKAVQRNKIQVDLKIDEKKLTEYSGKLTSLIESLDPSKIKIVKSEKNEKLIYLEPEKNNDYIKLDSLKKEIESSREWINKERADPEYNNYMIDAYKNQLTDCSNKLEKLEELIQKMENHKVE